MYVYHFDDPLAMTTIFSYGVNSPVVGVTAFFSGIVGHLCITYYSIGEEQCSRNVNLYFAASVNFSWKFRCGCSPGYVFFFSNKAREPNLLRGHCHQQLV